MFKILAGILILYVILNYSFSGLIDIGLYLAIISIAAGLDTIFHKKG